MIAEHTRPSLEELTERISADLEILHPGGLALTSEVAERSGVNSQSFVLDVAAGTGAPASHLSEVYGCRVVGIELSGYLVAQAQQRASRQPLSLFFTQGDGQRLPYADDTFDVALSECAVCLMDKERALQEMLRVVKPGGCVAIHDICWQPGTPQAVKEQLAQNEGERPETLAGWQRLFERVGFTDVQAWDQSALFPGWIRRSQAEIDPIALAKVFGQFVRRWGVYGLWTIWQSWRIYQSRHIGYGTVVGWKRGKVISNE
jgi:SAM-dependent methyltransferase